MSLPCTATVRSSKSALAARSELWAEIAAGSAVTLAPLLGAAWTPVTVAPLLAARMRVFVRCALDRDARAMPNAGTAACGLTLEAPQPARANAPALIAAIARSSARRSV
jgi:hypothetical protein